MRPSATPNSFGGHKDNRAQEKVETHEFEPIRAWVMSDVFFYFPTGHPGGDKLEGLEGDTEEGNDVLVRQTSPHHSLAMECLLAWSWGENEASALMTHLLGTRRIFSGIYP